MTRWMPFAWVTLALAGCGDLSNDDLQFAGGTPHAKEVAIQVAPATAAGQSAPSSSQALVGQNAEWYDKAKAVADSVNGVVYATVDLVDKLTHLRHPTERSTDRRVWGPFRNVDGKHLTIRIEVDRETTADGKLQWGFCMHAARDAAVTGAGPTSCTDGEVDGLEKVLWGHHVPTSKNDSLRSGEGVIEVEGRILKKLDPDADAGHLRIDFQFTKGGDDKQLHVNHVAPATLGTPSRVSDYDYGKTGGEIDMTFQFQSDVVGPAGVTPTPANPTLDETITLGAAWAIDGPGRADGSAAVGDLAADESITWTECWDSRHRRTYYTLSHPRRPILNRTEGDATLCPP